MRIDISNSTDISNVILELYGVQIKNTIKGITTDSRNLSKGDIYVAIKGEINDGHNYLNQVDALNASAVIVNKNKECVTKKYTEKKHGGLANIFFSDGKIGKVIKIKLKKRIGKQGSLPQAMRSALLDNIIIQNNRHVALGGVFRVCWIFWNSN